MQDPEPLHIKEIIERARIKPTAQQKIKRYVWLGLKFGFSGLWRITRYGMAMLILLGILLQFSFFQTFVVSLAVDWFSAKINHTIEVRSVFINFWESTIQFNQLKIKDIAGNPLLNAQELWLDFDYYTLRQNGDFHIPRALLSEGSFNLIVNKKYNKLNINILIDKINELTRADKPRKSSRSTVISFDRIRLSAFNFNYDDQRTLPISTENIDYSHFGFHQIEAEVRSLRVVADTIALNVRRLEGYERKTHLELCRLKTAFQYTKHYIHFKNLDLAVGNSIVKKNIFLNYTDPSDFSDFIHKVTIVAELDSSVLDSRDLALIGSPMLKKYSDIWRVDAKFLGKVTDFTLKNMVLDFGNQSHIEGDFAFKGLPNVDSLLMNLKIEKAFLNPKEVAQYIPQTQTNEFLARLGKTTLSGDFTGKPTDFVTKLAIKTGLGNLETAVELVLSPEDEAQSYYKGKIQTENLHLGNLLQLPYPLETINIKGEIEGTGFSPQTANFKLNAVVENLVFNQYKYQNLAVNGKLNRRLFEGTFIAKDTNLNFNLEGLVDFNKQLKYSYKPTGEFDFKSKINRIDLRALGFSTKEAIFSAEVDAKMQGLNLDSLVGTTTIRKLLLNYDNKALKIDSLEIKALRDVLQREFKINSELLALDLKGNFVFSDVLKDLQDLGYEYSLAFRNSPKITKNYYENKKKLTQKYYDTRFNLNCRNINPILALFLNQIYISPNTSVEGLFENGKTETFRLRTTRLIDSIIIGENKIYGMKMNVESNKTTDSTDIAAEVHIESQKQHLFGLDTKKFSLNMIWQQDNLEFDTELYQQKTSNFIKLLGNLSFAEDSLTVVFKPSQLKLLEENWRISASNQLVIAGQKIQVQDFSLINTQITSSRIDINGEISPNPKSRLDFVVKDVELEGFAEFLNTKISGILQANLFLENLYQKPIFLGEADIENLMYNKFLIGDITAKAELGEEQKDVQISAYLYRLGKHILDVAGIYNLSGKNQLNLLADLKNTDLEILEPFANGLVSKLRGSANGQLNITGNLSAPIVKGNVNINNGGLKVNYLGTYYTLEGLIGFQENSIDFKKMTLRDEYKHRANLTGSITHDSFSNFIFDLHGRFSDFSLLNTTIQDNNLFYGKAYATGNIDIRGFLDHLVLDIKARSEKDTKIILPLFTSTDVGNNDFIEYVSFKSDTLQKQISKKIKLSGIEMNFNLELNTNAEIEIIFDDRTGDIMRGTGNGNLQMNINTLGDFGIFGNYTIQEGSYNFTLAGILSKPFKVLAGSKITFVGDILESLLGINAVYEKSISLLPLINTTNQRDLQNPEFLRRYPIGVILDLSGKLLNPDIKLRLDLKKAKSTPNPTLQTALANFESRIQSDEQELKRQAAGILLMNSLFRENSFVGASSGSALNSISEFVSSQLSHYISQVDENLDVNLDINSTDINASRMRFSYRALDGRLRVTRDGGFTNTQNRADFANVIGDWTVEYLLSKQGELRAKMYTRNNQNLAQTFGTTAAPSNTLTGFSIIHTATFNNLKELLQKKEPENLKRDKLNQPLLSIPSKNKKSNTKGIEYQDEEEINKKTELKKDSSLLKLQHYLRNRLADITFKRDTIQEDNEQIPDTYSPENTKKNSYKTDTITKKNAINPNLKNKKDLKNDLKGDEDNEPAPDYLAKPDKQKKEDKPKETEKKKKNNPNLKGDKDNEPAPDYLNQPKEKKNIPEKEKPKEE